MNGRISRVGDESQTLEARRNYSDAWVEELFEGTVTMRNEPYNGDETHSKLTDFVESLRDA
jgi:hypothetical protein